MDVLDIDADVEFERVGRTGIHGIAHAVAGMPLQRLCPGGELEAAGRIV
jgi:hypothetical protein